MLQVYTASWDNADAVIKCQLGDVLHYELGEELEPRKEPTLFDKPTRGTSVKKFREMVHSHLKVRTLMRTVSLVQFILLTTSF